MTGYGKVRDADTNQAIRDADAVDWLKARNAEGLDREGGIFTDDDGTEVWVDGGPSISYEAACAIAEAGVV